MWKMNNPCQHCTALKENGIELCEIHYNPINPDLDDIQISLYFGITKYGPGYCIGIRNIYDSKSRGELFHIRFDIYEQLVYWLFDRDGEPKEPKIRYTFPFWNEIQNEISEFVYFHDSGSDYYWLNIGETHIALNKTFIIWRFPAFLHEFPGEMLRLRQRKSEELAIDEILEGAKTLSL